jgi:uncharacterized membrane protein YbhN (UPF0104 family)
VLVGLYLAGQQAVQQWRAESERLTAAVGEIDQQIQAARNTSERQDLLRQRQELETSIPRLSNLHWRRLALAGLLYALGMLPSAFLLRSALHSFGQQASIGTSIAAQLLGHVGKYVPGKAMVIVLRAGALALDGIRPLPATVCVFLETFLMMAVGGTVAALVVIWLPVPTWIVFGALAAAACACLPTLPPVLRRVTGKIIKTGDGNPSSRIGWPLFAAGWGWSLLSWMLIGASFTSVIAAIPSANPLPPAPQLLAIGTAAISLAVVAGFASLIPGGAGVRELVLTTILGVAIGPIQGLMAAIVTRVLHILVEGLLAAGSWLWLRRRRAVMANLPGRSQSA